MLKENGTTDSSTDEDLTLGDPLAVQWVGLRTFTARGAGSIPGWGTKIPQATHVCVCVCVRVCVLSHFSCVRLFVTQWTLAWQAPLSMGFSRQEYWSGLLFPSHKPHRMAKKKKKKNKLDPGQQGWDLAVSLGAVTWILRLTQGGVTGA